MPEGKSLNDVEPLYVSEQIKVPEGMPEILKEFTKAVIRERPADLNAFGVAYFARALAAAKAEAGGAAADGGAAAGGAAATGDGAADAGVAEGT